MASPRRTILALVLGAGLGLAPVAAGAVTTTPSATTAPAAYRAQAGNWFDTDDRETVVEAYESMRATVTPDAQWTGSTSACEPGTTSAAYRQATIDRINYFRAMAGVPADVVENTNLSAKAQAAAVMFAAEADRRGDYSAVIKHTGIEPSYACYTSTGATSASVSNLYQGRSGPVAIDGYIIDPGIGNWSVGHRAWLIGPSLTEVGIGDVPRSSGANTNVLEVANSAQHDFAQFDQIRQSDGWVAWPSPGYFPGPLLGDKDVKWSFTLPGAQMNGATVSMSSASGPTSTVVNYRSPRGGYLNDSHVAWSASVDLTPDVDTTYTVTVANVVVAGTAKTFTYDVTILGDQPADPAIATANARYVERVYEDFAGRTPTASELNAGVALVSRSGKTAFVTSLARSDAWIANVVDEMYRDTLDREGDAAGRAYWIAQVQAGFPVVDMASYFYASPEYLARNGGDVDAWVGDLYGVLLDRSPDTAGANFWASTARSVGAPTVARDFYQSKENRSARVAGLYQDLLGRGPDSAGREYWAGVLERTDDVALAIELASSNEYFMNATR